MRDNNSEVTMETALNQWGDDTNRKRISIDGNMLHQKTRSLCKDFGKRPPETVPPGRSLQVRDDYTDSGMGLNGNTELLERLCLPMKKLLTFPAEMELIRVHYYWRFQVSTGSLGMHRPLDQEARPYAEQFILQSTMKCKENIIIR